MDFGTFGALLVVGLLFGWLAGFVMKEGGYGLIRDLGLALVGSVVAGWSFHALGVYPGGGMLPAVLAATVGAAVVIIAQREFWRATPLGVKRTAR